MSSAEGLTAEPYYPIFSAHIKVQRKVCCCGQEVAELSTSPHDTNITTHHTVTRDHQLCGDCLLNVVFMSNIFLYEFN